MSKYFFSVFTCVRKKCTKLHQHHLAACIIGWLIRMSLFCQCSYLLNFQFVFLANRARQPGCLPYYSSVSVCRSPSLHSTLDNILRLREELAKVKIPFGDSHRPSSIWTHAYTPPLPSSLIPPRPQSSPLPLLSPPSGS